MYYKFVSESEVTPCPDNGKITVQCAGRDVETMVFNLPSYLDNNPVIALANGYKPFVVEPAPEYDAQTQRLAPVYTDGETEITQGWVITAAGGEEL